MNLRRIEDIVVPDAHEDFPIEFGPKDNLKLRRLSGEKQERRRRLRALREARKKIGTDTLVYFALCEGFCKIGHSGKPVSRIQNMNSGCPFEIKLLATMEGGRREEKRLHEKFADLCHSGEWFRYEGDLKDFVEGLICEEGNR